MSPVPNRERNAVAEVYRRKTHCDIRSKMRKDITEARVRLLLVHTSGGGLYVAGGGDNYADVPGGLVLVGDHPRCDSPQRSTPRRHPLIGILVRFT